MTPDRSAQRRVVALLLLVAALGGLGAVALGAAAERDPLAIFAGPTERITADPSAAREAYDEPEWDTHDVQEQPPRIITGPAPVIIALTLLGLVLLVLAIWVALRMRALARPAPVEAGEASEDELTAARARAALVEARTPLSSVVDAQDAVIAAWLVLERSLAEAGVPRLPSQTTLEFVVEVLATFDLDRAALDRLAGLYRRALFDPSPLQEADRTAAMEDLDRLTADLDALDPASPRRRTPGAAAPVTGRSDGGERA